MNEQIITRMITYQEWKGKSIDEIKALIQRGHEIKAEDQRIMDESGVLRSHHHFSDSDKDAIGTASQYDIMLEFVESGESFDEEE